jgi:predicted MFS family arabinose efflux permease
VAGVLASALGRPAVFGAVAVLAVLLILLTRTLPYHHVPSGQGMGRLTRALRQPSLLAGMWLVALPAVTSGLINVLGPLRMHRLGASAAGIGAAYLVAAGIEAAVSPAVGSLSDRRGRLIPLRGGVAAVTAILLCFTLPDSAPVLAAVIVATAAALGAFWAPAMAMLSDAAEAHGLDQGLAAALMNLAWAGGQIVGSGAGGAVAKHVGDGIPIAAGAALCALTLIAMARAPAWLRAYAAPSATRS